MAYKATCVENWFGLTMDKQITGLDIVIGRVDKGSHSNKNSEKATVDLASGNSTCQMMAYASPAFAIAFIMNPVWSILPGIYAKYFGLELAAIAAVILVARLFDGVTDPIIGYLSDGHAAAGGSRKTWVVVGGALFVTAAWFLYVPPRDVTSYYFLVAFLGFFLAYTIMKVPYDAWGAELATDYNQRAKIFSFTTACMFLGQIAFYTMPLLPFFSSGEFTPETLRLSVYISAGVVFVVVLWSRFFAPEGRVIAEKKKRPKVREVFKAIAKNKPFMIFLAAYLFAGISFGMWWGLQFIYLDSYLGLGDHIAKIFLWGDVAGLMSVPFWFGLVRMTSKSTAVIIGLIISIFIYIGCWLVTPGMSWLLSLGLVAGIAIGNASLNVTAAAMLGDIADYGIFKSRRNNTATYFAVLTLNFKITFGVGSGLALWIIGWFGFDATVMDATAQSDTAIFGLRLAFVVLPILLTLIGITFLIFTPINYHRHNIIRRRIERRMNNSLPQRPDLSIN